MSDQKAINPAVVTTTINLPATLQVRGVDGKAHGVSTQQWDDDFIAYMVVYAWSVRMQRCTASAKDKAKALREMYASMVAGETGNAEGGRGPTLDPVTKAWISYFGALGFKVASKAVSRNNLDQAQRMACSQAILAMEPEAAETINEQVATRLEAWKGYMEANDPALSAMIQAEKAKVAPKKAFVAPKGSF